MNSCWEILGIDPTDDERAIRRAYAKKLKITRPEDDAEAYQNLREAFDYALEIAPYQSQEPQDSNDDNDDDDNIHENPHHEHAEHQQLSQNWFNEIQHIWEESGELGVLRALSTLTEKLPSRDEMSLRAPYSAAWGQFLQEKNVQSSLLWQYGEVWFDWLEDENDAPYAQVLSQKSQEPDFVGMYILEDCEYLFIHIKNTFFQHIKEQQYQIRDLTAFQQFFQTYQNELLSLNQLDRLSAYVWQLHQVKHDYPEYLHAYLPDTPYLDKNILDRIREYETELEQIFLDSKIQDKSQAWIQATKNILADVPIIAQAQLSKKILGFIRTKKIDYAEFWLFVSNTFFWAVGFWHERESEYQRLSIWLETQLTEEEYEMIHMARVVNDYQDVDYFEYAFLNEYDASKIDRIWKMYEQEYWHLLSDELKQKWYNIFYVFSQRYQHKIHRHTAEKWLQKLAENQHFAPSQELLQKPIDSDDIEAFLFKYKQGGSHAFVKHWDELKNLLDQVPFDHLDRISWVLLRHLREHDIKNYTVWAQWGGYFNWLTDYRAGQHLTVEELEHLKKAIASQDPTDNALKSLQAEQQMAQASWEQTENPDEKKPINWWKVWIIFYLLAILLNQCAKS